MKIAPLYRAFISRNRSQGDGEMLMVHTGQHFSPNMSAEFFRDLEIPNPHIVLDGRAGSKRSEIASIRSAFEKVCLATSPSWVIVVGDVNSTVACAVAAKNVGIRVAHVEAGLRSYDGIPEEINRIATDAISELLFTTDVIAVENLKKEGINEEKIHFVGNTMIDSLRQNLARALQLPLPDGLEPRKYVVLTLHRQANVDSPGRLALVFQAMKTIGSRIPVIFPVHPRTRQMMAGVGEIPGIRMVEPLSYLPFLGLMAQSRMVITDSGGIQEETTVLGIPCLTMRDSTERPITCLIGTNVLVGSDPRNLVLHANLVLDTNTCSTSIPDRWDGHSAHRIVDILLAQS